MREESNREATQRAAVRAEVEAIRPLDDLETTHREATLAWIDSGAPLSRIRKPAEPPQHLIAYCVLLDARSVLLVAHRDAGLWLPTGGHVDPGEMPRATVAREIQEESALR